MTVFVDASAIVAMIAREPEARSFAARLDWDPECLTSAIAIWEATRSLPAARGIELEEARTLVADFVEVLGLVIVPIAADEAELAVEAHPRFGRGNHPARLNMGDCFAYACAKRRNIPILFKGEDFIHTDLRDATLE